MAFVKMGGRVGLMARGVVGRGVVVCRARCWSCLPMAVRAIDRHVVGRGVIVCRARRWPCLPMAVRAIDRHL